jgi:hypothetical protein
MISRFLSVGLVAAVAVWLGVLILAPDPEQVAAERPGEDCAVICMKTEVIIAWPVVHEPVFEMPPVEAPA